MSLDNIVAAIIDDANTSLYRRAIRLYELQIAIFYPRSFRTLISAANDARGADRRLRTARIYAGIKCLEHIEDELCAKNAVDSISIRDLAQNRDYQEIFDSIIAANGGWSRIRHSLSVKTFENQMSERRDLASAAAKIVDFSYRFEAMPNRGTYKGGVTTARYVVVNAKSYELQKKKSTIKNRWREFGSTAAFLYLLLIQNAPLMPPKLTAKRFSRDLLKQAEGVQELRNFFCAYQHVCDVLAPRGYKFEKLTLNLNCGVPLLATAALQADVIAAFENSKGAQG